MFTAFDTFGSEKRYIAADFERLPFYCALFVIFRERCLLLGEERGARKAKVRL
jgi:hypothetical protein